MKLVRYGQPGKEKPGLIDAAGKLRDLSGVVPDIGPEQLSDKVLAKLG
jgi:2,4-didehydro-3-deoxy-L-rhamnonate hydrolase